MSYTTVGLSFFEDDRLIPFERKGFAAQIDLLVSKTFSIGAPIVNEMDEPIPIIVIIFLTVVSIVAILFFPSKEELDKMKKMEIQTGKKEE